MKVDDLVADRFELVEFAGSGGMGTVFRARDRLTKELVALKFLAGDNEDRKRFAREIVHLAAISHPRVVRFISHGTTDDGRPFLVMEWVEGESLQHRLETQGLTAPEAVAVARQIASALEVLHQSGLVHRDLKPSNLMFEQGELSRLKLIDFGIARALDEIKSLTLTGTLVGTPGYMSPEQARGVKAIDARADVFSLGCVLYECLTGWTPFSGEHSIAVRTKILFAEPLPITALAPELPQELVQLVTRMLAKHPGERPASMAEVTAALASLPPIPAGPSRRTVDDEPRTVALRGGTPPTFVVLVGYPDVDGHSPRASIAPEAIPQLERALAKVSPTARLAQLGSAAVTVLVDDATHLAEVARACRREMPHAPIAITVVGHGLAVERGRDAIDRGVDQLFKAMLRASANARIWIDPAVRELLGDLRL